METIVPINFENNSIKSESNEQEQQRSPKVFACRNNCDAKFDSFKQLNQHILAEHREVIENKLFKCKYCKAMVKKKLMLKHLKTEHAACKFEGCDVRLPFLIMKHHMRQEHMGNEETKKNKIKVRKCMDKNCKREFQTRKDLMDHMKNDHAIEGKMRLCKFEGCNQSLGQFAMKEHILKEHRKDFKKECNICNFVCSSKSGWKEHRKMHTQALLNQHVKLNGTVGFETMISRKIDCVLDECDEQIKKRNMNFHLMKFHGLKFSCYLCRMSVKTKDHLRAHFKKHIFQAIVGPKCRHCGMKFSDKNSWRKHKHTAHSKKFVCAVCGKKFYTKNPFENHMKDKHADGNNPNGYIVDVALEHI